VAGPVIRCYRPLLLGAILLSAVGASLTAAPNPNGLLGGFLAALMLAVAAVDARRYIIPNELTAPAAALALLRATISGSEPGLASALWSAASGIATALPLLILMIAYRRWRGRDGLGLGDVKLAAVAGAWLAWSTILGVIELATLSALCAYVVNGYIRNRPFKATEFLPFGLFLAPAIWFGWLFEALTN
jgi:leader peptidase (prepilin peptidase)/N-methyltransferase